MLAVLEQRHFPVDDLRLFASDRSAGTHVEALGRTHEVRPLRRDSFGGVDLALFSAGSGTARAFGPAAREAGALVVDNSSAFRMEPDCPLVVPELNGGELRGHHGIVANPNCSAILLCMAVAPIQKRAGLARMVVCSYQAVSGAGARAMEELRLQEEADARGVPPRREVFPAVLAHNVIPWVQGIEPDGWSVEENKVQAESRRILRQPDLAIGATCVRVPVLRAHAQAVHAELRGPLSREEAIDACRAARGLVVHEEGFPTPREVAGSDDVHVGRIRPDRAFRPGVALWCVMDQLRKGAALNAVQIAELAMGIAGGS
jgi:aspartate-semialdehyde dehydrogenase